MTMDWEVCWVGKGEAHSPGGSNTVLSLRGIALPRRLPSGAAGAAASVDAAGAASVEAAGASVLEFPPHATSENPIDIVSNNATNFFIFFVLLLLRAVFVQHAQPLVSVNILSVKYTVVNLY